MRENIAVIGLGYVGLPLFLAFAQKFPGTIGFDIDTNKVQLLQQGLVIDQRLTIVNPFK